MKRLKDLESKSIFIIREAYRNFQKPVLLWSMGKDSTVLLWLCKKAFFGKIPFPVLHIDTGYKFKEIIDFREKYAKLWDLDLIVARNTEADGKGITPDKGRFECCTARKTDALKQAIKEHGYDGVFVGIRRDEHGIRNKERFFSPRDKQFRWNVSKEKVDSNEGDSPFVALQDTEFSGWNLFATDFGPETDHVRVHPLLQWSEREIWEYVKREKIPLMDLYFAKGGKRYRSLGCECCCTPVDSDADDIDKILKELKGINTTERIGRTQDKEHLMQKLRSLGYM